MRIKGISLGFRDLKREFIKLGSMAGIITILPSVGSTIFLGFVYQIAPWLQKNSETGVFIFIACMSILCGFALMATNILGVVSGYAFDFGIGVPAHILGICGAASIMFFLAKRHAFGHMLLLMQAKPKLQAVQSALLKENTIRTLMIVILIRLSPAFPFAATNFVLSASGMSLRIFMTGTILGMLPRSMALVFVGASLSELNFAQPQESWVLIVGIVATILAILVVGKIAKRTLSNMGSEHAGQKA